MQKGFSILEVAAATMSNSPHLHELKNMIYAALKRRSRLRALWMSSEVRVDVNTSILSMLPVDLLRAVINYL
jgi:hypothetical protein